MRTFVASIAFWIITLPAMASEILVSGNVGWSCGTGTGGFEPLCNPDVERGYFELLYDDSAVDSDPAYETGLFDSSVLSFRMIVEQSTRPNLEFELASGPTQISSRVLGGSDLSVSFRFLMSEASALFPVSEVSLGFVSVSFLSRGGDPSLAPTLAFWDNAYGHGANVRPLDGSFRTVGETDWAPRPIASPAPEPETLAMALLGLTMVGGAVLRSRRAR